MINKMLFAAAVCVGSMAVSGNTTQAGHGHCYSGHAVARPSVYAYRAPVAVVPYYGAYRSPSYRYAAPGFGPYSSYRPGYGSYIGPSVRFGGYPGYGYGYGYGRSGISIGFGF